PKLHLQSPSKLIDHRDNEIIALGKMHKHIAMRHPNRFRDISSRSPSNPIPRKQHHSRVNQPPPRRDLLFLPSNRLHLSPCHSRAKRRIPFFSNDSPPKSRTMRPPADFWLSRYSVSINSPYDRSTDVSSPNIAGIAVFHLSLSEEMQLART